MKKLNRKGFTLIELLAAVVIMLAISVIAVSSISSAIDRNKVKQDDAKKEVIISEAKLYYNTHRNTLGTSGCIPVSALDLSENEKKDSKGNDLNGGVRYNIADGTFEYVNSCN